MKRYKSGENREQLSLMPMSYDDMIDEENPVRAIDVIVENMDIFKKRKCLAEHPFGTVKRAFGYTYFLTRRTESVRAESCMHFFIYNLKRVLQIMGTQGIMQTV